jgi:hypothetical protein
MANFITSCSLEAIWRRECCGEHLNVGWRDYKRLKKIIRRSFLIGSLRQLLNNNQTIIVISGDSDTHVKLKNSLQALVRENEGKHVDRIYIDRNRKK